MTRQDSAAVLVFDIDPSLALDECLGCLDRDLDASLAVETVSVPGLERLLASPLRPAGRVAVVPVGRSSTRGGEVLHWLRTRWPDLPVMVLSAVTDVDDISQWLGAGASDYATPPFTRASLVPRLLRLANTAAEPPMPSPEIEGMIGRSAVFTSLIEQVRAVARCDGTVLIQGDTGTGKELCARAIHRLSARHGRPFCAVNCGSIPRELVENELFGHHKAAYTGASAAKVGLIGEAEGGTLLFDEVDCFGAGEQATLLRFMQNQEYRPLGATRVLRADVRILAATNANLADKARQGEFRGDLFYRLDMLRIRVPSLRDRRDDIPLLARHALQAFARKFRARAKSFSPQAVEALVQHDWPGNVRELEHVIGRAVAFAFHDEVVTVEHLNIDREVSDDLLTTSLKEGKRRVVREFERARLCAYLAAHQGNIARAARAAGKNRRAFWELMRKYGIRAEDFT